MDGVETSLQSVGVERARAWRGDKSRLEMEAFMWISYVADRQNTGKGFLLWIRKH